jgi:hypothetical protein
MKTNAEPKTKEQLSKALHWPGISPRSIPASEL